MSEIQSKHAVEELADELEVGLEDLTGLYSSYFEEMRSEITEMEQLTAKEDWHMLERVIHNVKGVSANLKVCGVFLEAEKFDALLKENKVENAAEYVRNIISLIHSAEKNIKGFFEQKGLVL